MLPTRKPKNRFQNESDASPVVRRISSGVAPERASASDPDPNTFEKNAGIRGPTQLRCMMVGKLLLIGCFALENSVATLDTGFSVAQPHALQH